MATSFAWFRSKICDGSGQGNYSLLSTLYSLLSTFYFPFSISSSLSLAHTRLAEALRTILGAAGRKLHKHVTVEIIETTD